MFPGISPFEMMILAVIALLLFGKKLPDVARSLGKSMVEFKRGIRGFEDEMRSVTNPYSSSSSKSWSDSSTKRRPEADDQEQEWTAPKFEPPTSEPVAAAPATSEEARAEGQPPASA